MAGRRFVNIRRASTGELLLRRARWGASFGSRLRGLMFRRSLAPGEALILVEHRASRAATTIHMFFVPFDIAVVWLDDAGCVVDSVRARPWRPAYAPRSAARYVLETHPEFLARVVAGEVLNFEDDAA